MTMKMFEKIFDIDPEKLAKGGPRVERYLVSKNFLKVGTAAIALGLAADAAGKKWGAPLALAGSWVEFCGGGGIAIEAPHLEKPKEVQATPSQPAPTP